MKLPAFAAAILAGSIPSKVLHNTLGDAVVERNTTMLITPAAHIPLPTPDQVSSSINITNIQADVMIGMRQSMATFSFFSITDASAFKKQMSGLIPQITTVGNMLTVASQPPVMMNIALSQSGLIALGITDNLNDSSFTAGQFANAGPVLAEQTDSWMDAFKGTNIHGVFILASDDANLLSGQNRSLQNALSSSRQILYSIGGQVRPGDQEGHEHFGFMDGIGQPLVKGFGNPFPGQTVVEPGTLLLGGEQDNFTRPSWVKDGSFVVFRQLQQLVPEFNKFAQDNAAPIPGMPANLAADLTAARMIGRWKSGAPVPLAPLFDDPDLGADPTRNNNFTFEFAGFNLSSDQSRCPFSAHIRKNVPRKDLDPPDLNHHVLRSGVPYGPEVTSEEEDQQTTSLDRGLLFTCYQSRIQSGFEFLQKAWMSNTEFVGQKNVPPGYDPIIGANNGSARWTMGLNPMEPLSNTTLPAQFVRSRGGEYFYMPSLTDLSFILNS